MKFFAEKKRKLGIWLSLLVLIFGSSNLNAQFETKWMAVGSTHNWYSEIGSEIEEGLIKVAAVRYEMARHLQLSGYAGSQGFMDRCGKL